MANLTFALFLAISLVIALVSSDASTLMIACVISSGYLESFQSTIILKFMRKKLY
jgi:hypothetical protein